MATDRIPPQNLDAEKSILASCLLFPDDLIEFADLLRPEDFYRTAPKYIFEACLKLHSEKQSVDIVTVAEELMAAGRLDENGGHSYLSKILDEPTATDNEHYAKILRDKAVKRRLIEIGNAITKRAHHHDHSAEGQLDEAQKSIMAIDWFGYKNSAISVHDLAITASERYENLYKSAGHISGISCGLIDLDMATCGFQDGELIVIAARPSMGKTALMNCLALNAAEKDHPCGIFSLEMSNQQIFYRMIAGESGVNSMKFRSGRFSGEDWNAISKAQSKLHNLPIFIDDRPSLFYGELRRRARQMKIYHGIEIFFVDYIQLLQGDKQNGRVEEVSSIFRNLKALAKELNLPVVALSQLNRAVESRDDKRPRLSDLRDSGAIEQDADMVWMIYREEVYNQTTDNKGRAEIEIVKQRNGPTGTILLSWQERLMKFYSFEKNHEF
jgi:replicative DNA helicase